MSRLRIEIAIVGDELLPPIREHRLDHRMTTLAQADRTAGLADLGLAPTTLDRHLGETREDVDGRQRARQSMNPRDVAGHSLAQAGEVLLFEGDLTFFG